MKKSFFILMLIFFAFHSIGQQTKSIECKFSDEDYLKKCKGQIKTGFILLGGGVASFSGGLIAMQHSTSKGGREMPFLLGGMAMAATSIPFFIASFSNKLKAKVYITKQATIAVPGISNPYQTSVSLRIGL